MAWVWLNKERMVLFIMLVFLAYRVYEVVYPPPPPEEDALQLPQSKLPEDQAVRKDLGLPATPPVKPPLDLPGDYTALYRRNPFWYFSGKGGGGSGSGSVTAEDLNIQLLNIQEVDGRYRAQLRTTSTTKWYYEGEPFEEYTLERVNPQERTVVIFAERYGRRITLSQ